MSNMPARVTESDPYFTQEDEDTCAHSAQTCVACQDEDAKAMEEKR